ncbi:MAG: hypothetical protein JNK72_21170 [Myxococcales bacterium]|nr:hypothetical protein [Myxococcales bacterium]
MHNLTRDELDHAIGAWVYISGAGEPWAEAVGLSLGWLRHLWDAGDDHLPLDLVHDLGLLMLRGKDFRFGSSRGLERFTPEERQLRLAYEDKVLGRWALDPTVAEAHVVIAGLPAAQRQDAVAHAVGLALRRAFATEVSRGVRGNPAHLRGLREPWLERLLQPVEALDARVDGGWLAWARERQHEAIERLGTQRLLTRDALWEVEHLADLPRESTRMALREILDVGQSVGPVSPSVGLQLRHARREVPIEAEEADQYPAGGFDAISTRGNLENLVRSEVSYVGEGSDGPRGIDLFDIRFAEGELLYYTRDESPLLDARRDVTLVFDGPRELRHKVPGLPSQTLVIAEAVAMTLYRDLMSLFGPSGARVKIAWHCHEPGDLTDAEEELGLFRLRLAADLAHQRVSLAVVDSFDALGEGGRMVFSPRPPQDTLYTAWVRTGGAAWTLDKVAYHLDDPEGAGPVLRSLTDALLVASARRPTSPRRARRRAS